MAAALQEPCYAGLAIVAKTFPLRIGPRDFEILSSLDLVPLTASQLLKLSHIFEEPFPDEHTVRRRLRKLLLAGLIRAWPYAVASQGRSPLYSKLTRDGYRLLYGQNVALPKRRYFEPVSTGHQFHTCHLADFLVHLLTQGHDHGVSLRQFARENSVRLEAGGFTVYPDCAFRLLTADGRPFNFVVELDNGTERIRSLKDVESIERKVRAYDLHQSQFEAHHPGRYLVLFVTTRGPERWQRILDLAARTMHNPKRTVFLAADLSRILNTDPYRDPVFQDHRGLRRTIVPTSNPNPRSKHCRQATQHLQTW